MEGFHSLTATTRDKIGAIANRAGRAAVPLPPVPGNGLAKFIHIPETVGSTGWLPITYPLMPCHRASRQNVEDKTAMIRAATVISTGTASTDTMAEVHSHRSRALRCY
jgi:hypothetical protein